MIPSKFTNKPVSLFGFVTELAGYLQGCGYSTRSGLHLEILTQQECGFSKTAQMEDVAPSLVFPGMHVHTHINTYALTHTHTSIHILTLNLFPRQSAELPVVGSSWDTGKGRRGCKPSTGSAGMSF